MSSDAQLLAQALATTHAFVPTATLRAWEEVIREAREAKLLGALHTRVQSSGLLEKVPAAPRAHLVAGARLAVAQRKVIEREIAALAVALRSVPAQPVLLKGAAYLAAVFISNLPESLGASVALLQAGRTRHWIRILWWSIVAMSAIAAAVGFWLVSETGPRVGAAVQAFAAGALLTMIADEMAPQAFGRSALYTGLATSAGFVVAFLLSSAE